MYAQRVDASGTPQWTDNGVAICTAKSYQVGTEIISDGTGGAIITWADDRNINGDIYNRDIYAQRVHASGNVRWTKNGEAVCTASDIQDWAVATNDGSGGAIITWWDWRSFSGDIYAQRILNDGTLPFGKREPIVTRKTENFAICIGIDYNNLNLFKAHYRADKGAEAMAKIFSAFMPSDHIKVLTGDMNNSGVTKGEIEGAINSIKAKPGSTLFVFLNGHGNSFNEGNSENNGPDEYVQIGPGEAEEATINDDELYSYLHNMKNSDDINKWVFIDACHSGGFWGYKDEAEGDLDKLHKILLITSATEESTMHYRPWGYGHFTHALEDALSIDGGTWKADKNKDNALTHLELDNYLAWWSPQTFVGEEVYEGDFGDPTIFSADMWHAQSMYTPDIMPVKIKSADIAPIIFLLLD
jgi:hypothetical protein